MSAIYGEGLAVMDIEQETQTNGLTAPPLSQPQSITKRRMPVRTRRVDLDGDYAGWWAEIRTNAPFGLFLSLSALQGTESAGTQEIGELADLLPRLVTAWNFVDEEGEPIPCDGSGIRAIPTDLFMMLVGKMGEGVAVPKE